MIDVNDRAQLKCLLLYLLKQFKAVCREAGITYYASGGTCLGAVRHQGIIPWDDDIDVMMPRQYYDAFVETCGRMLPPAVVIRTRENDPYFCGEYIKMCYRCDDGGYSELSIDVFFLDDTDPKRKLFRAIQNRVLIELFCAKSFKVFRMGMGGHYVPHNILRRCLASLLGMLPLSFIDRLHKRLMTAEKQECDYWVNWGACYSYKKATYKKSELGVPKEMPFENTTISVAGNPEEILLHLYGPNYMTPPPPEKRTTHGVKPFECSALNLDDIKREIGVN